MEGLVISNNRLVNANCDSIKVDGLYIDVLYEVRKMIYEGHSLISYPLAASIRMILSPVRSILVSKEKKEVDTRSIDIIEDSINKYLTTLGKRNPDIKNIIDYETIDFELLKSAMEENNFINCNI